MTQHMKLNNIGLAILADVSQEIGSLETALAALRERVKAAMAALSPTSESPCHTEEQICDGSGLSADEEVTTQEMTRHHSEGAPPPCATEHLKQIELSDLHNDSVNHNIPIAVGALAPMRSNVSDDPAVEQTCVQGQTEDVPHEAASSEEVGSKSADDDSNGEAIVACIADTLQGSDDETPSTVHGKEILDGAKHSGKGTGTIGYALSDISSTEHDEAAIEPDGQGTCLEPGASGCINVPIAEAVAEMVLDGDQVGDGAAERSSDFNDPVAPAVGIDPDQTTATSNQSNPAPQCGKEASSLSYSSEENEAAVESEQPLRPVRSNRWFVATSIALVLVATVTVTVTVSSRDLWIAAL